MNSYEILGVRPDASDEEIRRAYRSLARRTHPDVGGEATKPLFLSVTAAMESLADPQRRAAYDRANGLNSPAPEPEPSGSRSTRRSSPAPGDARTGPPAGGTGGDPGPDAPGPLVPGPHSTWRSLLGGIPERRRRSPLPWAAGALGAAWVAVLVYLALHETAFEGPQGSLPAGTGVGLYLICQVTGTLRSCWLVRRGLGTGWGPLSAAAAGALSMYVMDRAHPFHAAGALATGLVLSLTVSVMVRRHANLIRMGQGAHSPKVTSFTGQDPQAAETAEARHLTIQAFTELLTAPGMRLLENVPVRGRSVSHILLNGDRAAVIDSRAIPSWVASGLTGDLEIDAPGIMPNIETSIAADVTDVRSRVRSVRGWLVLHPCKGGSVNLKTVRGVPVTAASPASALEEIGQWLAEGRHAGTVDPALAYRLVSGRSPSAPAPA